MGKEQQGSNSPEDIHRRISNEIAPPNPLSPSFVFEGLNRLRQAGNSDYMLSQGQSSQNNLSEVVQQQ